MTEVETRGGAPTALRELLTKLQEVQQDPAWVAAREAEAEAVARFEAEQLEANTRAARAAVITRERVPLRRDIEQTLVAGAELAVRTKSLETVQRWMLRDDVPPVLVLSGGTGCGKSVAAAWAVVERSGRWRTANQLCRLFTAQFDEDLLQEQALVMRCSLLAIEDAGTEFDAARMASTLLDLIENRQHSARRHRTIITTNMGRAAFLDRYAPAGSRVKENGAKENERLASRFDAKAGIVAWVSDTAPDLRRKPR